MEKSTFLASTPASDPRLRFYFGERKAFFFAAGYYRFTPPNERHAGQVFRHPEYRLLWLLEGAGECRRPGRPGLPLRPGTLLCRQPGAPYALFPRDPKRWREFYLVLPPCAHGFFHPAGLLPPGETYLLPLDAASHRAMDKLLAALRAARSITPLLPPLLDFLAFLRARTGSEEREQDEGRCMEAAKALLAAQLGEALRPELVAHRVGMAYEAFRKRFKALTGEAPKAYRQRLRLQAAAEALLTAERSITALSEDFGYRDLFAFSRQFRARFGVSPRTWRANGR